MRSKALLAIFAIVFSALGYAFGADVTNQEWEERLPSIENYYAEICYKAG